MKLHLVNSFAATLCCFLWCFLFLLLSRFNFLFSYFFLINFLLNYSFFLMFFTSFFGIMNCLSFLHVLRKNFIIFGSSIFLCFESIDFSILIELLSSDSLFSNESLDFGRFIESFILSFDFYF